MDISRSVKRLALILVLAMFVILLSRSLLDKTITNLSLEAEKKQQAKTDKSSLTLPVSAVEDTSASAVTSTDTEPVEAESAAVATEDRAVTP